MSLDTIVALSSGGLPSGVAVIRVSGAAVCSVLRTLVGQIPRPRLADYRSVRDRNGALLDRGVVLFFPAPASFTGEDCAEFQVHGGRAVVAAIVDEICRLENCRPAEPGEFMRRAFLNGKLDLLAAEATGDLIGAETEAQRRFAISNANGGHSQLYASWRQRIVNTWAMVEAGLDFADEDDIGDEIGREKLADVSALAVEIRCHLDGYRRAEVARNGFDVVIAGAPNAGKSSLINALARRDVAIVNEDPGTTRDLIEISLDLDGTKVRLTDSAGIREATSKVEKIGIDRAIKRADEADLILYLQEANGVAASPLSFRRPLLSILSKADTEESAAGMKFDLAISSKTGLGLSELLRHISIRASAVAPSAGEILPWKLRHVELLREAEVHLDACIEQPAAELIADHLRTAALSIGRIAGAVDVEDLLDVIFRQFCIGK